MGYALLLAAAVIETSTTGNKQNPLVGVYLCTTAERAAIVSQHREGAAAPSARVDGGTPTRFKIQITQPGKGAKSYRIVEIAYDGADRDGWEWQDDNSVLHSVYVGDGSVFHALDGPAFLTIGKTAYGGASDALEFYHAGFELPGGEDTQLAVRWGRCSKVAQR